MLPTKLNMNNTEFERKKLKEHKGALRENQELDRIEERLQMLSTIKPDSNGIYGQTARDDADESLINPRRKLDMFTKNVTKLLKVCNILREESFKNKNPVVVVTRYETLRKMYNQLANRINQRLKYPDLPMMRTSNETMNFSFIITGDYFNSQEIKNNVRAMKSVEDLTFYNVVTQSLQEVDKNARIIRVDPKSYLIGDDELTALYQFNYLVSHLPRNNCSISNEPIAQKFLTYSDPFMHHFGELSIVTCCEENNVMKWLSFGTISFKLPITNNSRAIEINPKKYMQLLTSNTRSLTKKNSGIGRSSNEPPQNKCPEVAEADRIACRRIIHLFRPEGFVPIYCCDNYKPILLEPTSTTNEFPPFKCPGCKKAHCNKCGTAFHGTLPCDHDIDEKTLELINTTSTICPTCNNSIHKIEGCNHMRCECGTHFCYLCGVKFGIGNTGYEEVMRIHYADAQCNQFEEND
jgi:hypothetical protein